MTQRHDFCFFSFWGFFKLVQCHEVWLFAVIKHSPLLQLESQQQCGGWGCAGSVTSQHSSSLRDSSALPLLLHPWLGLVHLGILTQHCHVVQICSLVFLRLPTCGSQENCLLAFCTHVILCFSNFKTHYSCLSGIYRDLKAPSPSACVPALKPVSMWSPRTQATSF